MTQGMGCEDTAGHGTVARGTEDKPAAEILSKTLQVLLSDVVTTKDQVLTFLPDHHQ